MGQIRLMVHLDLSIDDRRYRLLVGIQSRSATVIIDSAKDCFRFLPFLVCIRSGNSFRTRFRLAQLRKPHL